MVDESRGNLKTPQGQYLTDGLYPVVDQGKELVAGYVNDPSRLCRVELPAIVFGDHTRCFKYVDFPFCMGANGTKILRPKIEADVRYLYHYLRQLRLTEGGYDRHFKYLKRTDIALPPLLEQRRIADLLDRAEALRARRRSALALLDLLGQSLFLDMFGDPLSNPKRWKCTTLSAVSTSIVDGPFGSNLKLTDYVDSGVPVLQGKNITGNRFEWLDIRFVSNAKAAALARSKVREGDHLMIKIGSIGYSAILDDLRGYDCAIIPANLAAITPRRDLIDDSFLHAFLANPRVAQAFSGMASRTAQPALSLGKIRSFAVPLPPLELQRTFSRRLAAVDTYKDLQLSSLSELNALFASTQHWAFTVPL
jgi:type I restriction enzyme S subunit